MKLGVGSCGFRAFRRTVQNRLSLRGNKSHGMHGEIRPKEIQVICSLNY